MNTLHDRSSRRPHAGASIFGAALVAMLLRGDVARAQPRGGRAFPEFSVDDLEGTRHTRHDLTGRWTVICAMTDKDIGPALERWWRPIELVMPPGSRMLTFTALDIFALVPSSTVRSSARERTPRSHWNTVWLSRDGSLASQLGLGDSELPWVFVVDPQGTVVLTLHGEFDAAGLARIAAALPRPGLSGPVDAGAPGDVPRD